MCDKCNKTGLIQFYEMVPAPFGNGDVRMPVTELCTCLEDSMCPMCDGELETLSDDQPDILYCVNCEREWKVK